MASHDYENAPLPAENTDPNDRSAESSNPVSREGSQPPKRRKNVQFTPGGESVDIENKKETFDLRDDTNQPPRPKPLPKLRYSTGTMRNGSPSAIGRQRSPTRISERSEDIADSPARAPVRPHRPTIMRLPSSDSVIDKSDNEEGDEDKGGKESEEDADVDLVEKAISQQSAQDRAERLSRLMGSHSAPGSHRTSPERRQNSHDVRARSPPPSPPSSVDVQDGMPFDPDQLPLKKLKTPRKKFGIEDSTDDEDEEEPDKPSEEAGKKRNRYREATARLFKHYTGKDSPKLFRVQAESPDSRSGAQTPVYERDPHIYVPRPKKYRDGYLSSLLKLYNEEGVGSALSHIPAGPEAVARAAHRRDSNILPLIEPRPHGQSQAGTPRDTPGASPVISPAVSGTSTPKGKHQKWYYKNPKSRSTGALSDLVSSSSVLAQPGVAKHKASASNEQSAVRPKPKQKQSSGNAIDTLGNLLSGKKRRQSRQSSVSIHVNMAETVKRQAYLQNICRCLMQYGAPTHRLEGNIHCDLLSWMNANIKTEYMRMSARVLEIDGQFLYIPGCMIISFDDAQTHTTEVKIVRTTQGIHLSKLRDIHEVYKEVIHDIIDVEEATHRLDEITRQDPIHGNWNRVLVHGFASATVGPFAFGARPIDLPIAFILGCILGCLQIIVAPRSDLYANVFEISAAVITSFLARAFGSIHGGKLFCFSALAQSAITMILPGYTVLCGSLELQSRNIVAGSVRMVYAVLYSLFLGFGITIGTTVYGALDNKATSQTMCDATMPFWFKWIFVPPFTLAIIYIHQAKFKQMPVMVGIAFIGYMVNYWAAQKFTSNAQIANTLGALAIGLMGNLYSRLRHGMAAAVLLPAIFVQVPSGLSAGASLVSGLTSANEITKNNGSVANGTTTVSYSSLGTADVNSMVFNVAYSIIQVVIGITVGLFLSALIVYPFGKKRSGLFSF